MGKYRISCLVVGAAVAWIAVAAVDARGAAQTPPTPPADQKAQIEKGRRVAAEVCTTCHSTFGRMVQVHKQTPEQWRDTVYFMIGRGAQLMPDEIDSVVAFLAATAAPGSPTPPAAGRGGGRGGGVGAGPAGRGAGAGGGRGQQGAGGDGAAILQRTCQQCHELSIATNKLASEDWGAVVTRMTTYGAPLTAAERQILIEYLNQPR